MAWFNLRELKIKGEKIPLSLTWSDLTHFTSVVEVELGQKELKLEGMDFQGEVIDSVEVEIEPPTNL